MNAFYYVNYYFGKCFNPSADVLNALIFNAKVTEGFDFTTLHICSHLHKSSQMHFWLRSA